MSHDPLPSSHMRLQSASAQSSPSKKFARGFGDCFVQFQRHRFLLTMLAILAIVCTIYLYYAVTLGSTRPCSSLSGAERARCQSSLHRA